MPAYGCKGYQYGKKTYQRKKQSDAHAPGYNTPGYFLVSIKLIIGVIEKIVFKWISSYYNKVQLEEHLPEKLVTNTDEDLLSQVLINLIKNALESFEENKTIVNPVVQLRAGKETGRIKIDICNNGEEIPPELREQIFVPFFTTKENGTGIGLSLSKQVMLKLGGDIKLGANSKGYTCFTVTLPAAG